MQDRRRLALKRQQVLLSSCCCFRGDAGQEKAGFKKATGFV